MKNVKIITTKYIVAYRDKSQRLQRTTKKKEIKCVRK